jgi:hypothetical protein
LEFNDKQLKNAVLARNEAISELCQSTPTNMFVAVMPPALPWLLCHQVAKHTKIRR